MIQAECHSDDRKIEITFDATPWWEQATDKQKQALRDCGGGGDYPADAVAEYMADHDDGVRRMFNYLEIVDDQGYECNVELPA